MIRCLAAFAFLLGCAGSGYAEQPPDERPDATHAMLPREDRTEPRMPDDNGQPLLPSAREHAAKFEKYERLYRTDVARSLVLLAGRSDDPLTRVAHARLLRRLGRLYEDVGNYGDAAERYAEAARFLEHGEGRRGTNDGRAGERMDLRDEKDAWKSVSNDRLRMSLVMGNFDRADELIKARRARATEPDPDLTAFTAVFYLSMGDFVRAEPLFKAAVKLHEKELATAPATQRAVAERALGIALHNLGVFYETSHDYVRAQPLLRQEVQIASRNVVEFPNDLPHSLDSLAVVLMRQLEFKEAEQCFTRAETEYRDLVGEGHPALARTMANHGALCIRRHEFERAEQLLRQALELLKVTPGPMHADYADNLTDLALLYRTWKRPADAQCVLEEALHVTQANMDLLSEIQSERQQLATAQLHRERLDLLFGISLDGELDPAVPYAHWLQWKGEVFRRQRLLSALRANSELAEPKKSLEIVSGRLSTLRFAGPGSVWGTAGAESWQTQLAKLESQREELEAELVKKSQGYRAILSRRQRGPDDIRKSLASDAVLLDFAEFTNRTIANDGALHEEKRLLAFCVRSDRPIALTDLGPVLPIYELVDRWRKATCRPGLVVSEAALAAGSELRRQLWDPLSRHLEGISTVLVSPDGELGKLPFAAIPGAKPDTYLVDDYVVSVTPVPLWLAEISEVRVAKTLPSLLVVGDVDYAGSPGKGESQERIASSVRLTWREAGFRFAELPQTFTEISTIAGRFKRSFRQSESPLQLDRKTATEAAFRRFAPQHRYLHLATHGFFAADNAAPAFSSLALRDGGQRSDAQLNLWMRGLHPGLLSGVALTGANLAPEANQDDGILTALEVAVLDLRQVDLAVLSACETGLGKVAGGEGLLGLQRGFQIAGARSVVATLWTIDDKATVQLMDRFYENLWERDLGKAEALRQAQIWMMREGRPRGLELVDPESRPATRLPPYYWAAFSLSGDWR